MKVFCFSFGRYFNVLFLCLVILTTGKLLIFAKNGCFCLFFTQLKKNFFN